MIVCDTGPLVAAADRDDGHNRACTDLFTGLHLAHRQVLVPAPVVAEVGYLLGSRNVYSHLMKQATADQVDAATDLLTRHRRGQSVGNP
ncbi:MAG: hypothetical protein ACRCYX_01705 [Dermatophilaceae bacterium]